MIAKIAIILLIVLVAVSISYYFFYFLPKLKTNEMILTNQEKCQSIGQKLYNHDIASKGEELVGNPQYAYNQKLNTCLYSNDIIQGNEDFYLFVKNSFSNQDIIYFYTAKDLSSLNTFKNFKAYNQERSILMAGN